MIFDNFLQRNVQLIGVAVYLANMAENAWQDRIQLFASVLLDFPVICAKYAWTCKFQLSMDPVIYDIEVGLNLNESKIKISSFFVIFIYSVCIFQEFPKFEMW